MLTVANKLIDDIDFLIICDAQQGKRDASLTTCVKLIGSC